jgi:RimJ/RimL family protein N-acetyltransferase
MTAPAPILETFDPATASMPDLVALHAFTSRLRTELMPDDPLTPLEEAIAVWRQTASAATVATWVARETPGGAVVGRGQVAFADTAENRRLANGSLEVLPELRRRGLARSLLARMAGVMREHDRPVLVGSTLSRAPGGAAFMERLGAQRGLETTVYQLHMADLDLARLRERLAAPPGDAFELGFWDGAHAEADLEAIADLYAVMGTQPTGTLAVEAGRPTPAQLRQVEAALAARGMQRWTAYVRERASGRFAGFTEVFWQPRAGELLHQGNTGVFPAFRGRGLGARLKAAMLDRVARERPEVRRVRTTMADSNAAMASINRALGFAPCLARTIWQADLPTIEAWLGVRA